MFVLTLESMGLVAGQGHPQSFPGQLGMTGQVLRLGPPPPFITGQCPVKLNTTRPLGHGCVVLCVSTVKETARGKGARAGGQAGQAGPKRDKGKILYNTETELHTLVLLMRVRQTNQPPIQLLNNSWCPPNDPFMTKRTGGRRRCKKESIKYEITHKLHTISQNFFVRKYCSRWFFLSLMGWVSVQSKPCLLS